MIIRYNKLKENYQVIIDGVVVYETYIHSEAKAWLVDFENGEDHEGT